MKASFKTSQRYIYILLYQLAKLMHAVFLTSIKTGTCSGKVNSKLSNFPFVPVMPAITEGDNYKFCVGASGTRCRCHQPR